MSERAKHTPGPWMAAARHSSVVGWPIFQPATGRLICNINYVQRTAIDPSVTGDQSFNLESRANALLIAAAPDLLACQTMGQSLNTPDFLDWVADRIVGVYGESPNTDFVLSLRDRAAAHRAAVAKATGSTE